MSIVRRIRHFGLCAASAESELSFHRDLLGLQLAAREPAGAGRERLLFGPSDDRNEGCISILCFGSNAPAGRLGGGGPRGANLSVPEGSLPFWSQRLAAAGITVDLVHSLGSKRIEFAHPSGTAYSLVEFGEQRPRSGSRQIAASEAITGLHGATISLTDVREAHTFLIEVLDAAHLNQEIAKGDYRLSDHEAASRIELWHEPYRAPGTWRLGVGTPHHLCLELADADQADVLHRRLFDFGLSDVAVAAGGDKEMSMWVRIPGGTLLEFVFGGAR